MDVTGDGTILDEIVPFLESTPLEPGEMELYQQPSVSSQTGTLLEHCTRAIERSLTMGPHGLPLIGSGDWNRRAYYDDGMPLGSSQNDECRIDAIAQSWAVLSGAAPLARAERAMDGVRTHLVSRGGRVVLLLTPPFDRSSHDPGYIK